MLEIRKLEDIFLPDLGILLSVFKSLKILYDKRFHFLERFVEVCSMKYNFLQ